MFKKVVCLMIEMQRGQVPEFKEDLIERQMGKYLEKCR